MKLYCCLTYYMSRFLENYNMEEIDDEKKPPPGQIWSPKFNPFSISISFSWYEKLLSEHNYNTHVHVARVN